MHYYQHHIGDYLSHTANLSLTEHGVYLRLLQCYYMSEMPITGDYYRLIGARTDEEKQATDYILATYFVASADGFRQERCDRDIEAFHQKSDKCRKAVSKRWNNECNTSVSEIDTSVSKTDRSDILTTNHKPITSNHTKQPKGENPVLNLQSLITLGIEEKYARDFLAVRKAKRAPLTQTALDGIIREGKKAGMELPAVIRMCAEKSWQGFDAKWVKPDPVASETIDYAGIISLYNRILSPPLAPVLELTENRKVAISVCASTKSKYNQLGFWEAYFNAVAQSDYLMGRVKNWVADFDFLIKHDNFVKIIEGSYK